MEIEVSPGMSAANRSEPSPKSIPGDEYLDYPCDLCGAADAVEVPHCRVYTNGQPVHICRQCGFVYVIRRRSAEDIADNWSNDIFGTGYTAAIPAMKARLTYVAEFIDGELGLRNKRICDIGSGEGEFLKMVRSRNVGTAVFGIEPSSQNCQLLKDAAIDCYHGTLEDYRQESGSAAVDDKVDIVTIMWTLENCQSCLAMLGGAWHMLEDDGHVVVATGSRILVPFKKPLHDYFGINPADTHAFRFSANTLRGVLAVSGFEVTHVNRYQDSDILCMNAKKAKSHEEISWIGDNYLEVYNFFERWHVDTEMYYPRGDKLGSQTQPMPYIR